MNAGGLTEREWQLILGVFTRHPEITGVILYGSRAKCIASATSDIDLALDGALDALKAQAISNELDELPLPYHFDIRALSSIRNQSLREHINRVGVRVYR